MTTNMPYELYCQGWSYKGEPHLIRPSAEKYDVVVEGPGFEPDPGEPLCGCYPVGLTLDAEDILEHALAEHYEDAIDNVDSDGLQESLDAWLESNQVYTYYEEDILVWNNNECRDIIGALEASLRWLMGGPT